MLDQAGYATLLKRVDAMGREIEHLRRDLFHNLATRPEAPGIKPSLFGSVRAGDIIEEMIAEAKQALFQETGSFVTRER
jgi:hypothetical protein